MKMLNKLFRSFTTATTPASAGQSDTSQNVPSTTRRPSSSPYEQPTSLTPTAPPLPPDPSPGVSAAYPPVVNRQRRAVPGGAMQRIRDLLECAICLEELVDPRVLPCHHSFCLGCLDKIERRGGRRFRCPTCNLEVEVRSGMRELPSDFRSNALRACLLADDDDNDDVYLPQSTISASHAATTRSTVYPDINAAVSTASALSPSSTSDPILGLITCPVCEDLISEPRRLSCGHSFCVRCLEFMLPATGSTIYCPTCQHTTTVGGGSVFSLPVDEVKCNVMRIISSPEEAYNGEANINSEAAARARTRPSVGPAPTRLYPDLSYESERANFDRPVAAARIRHTQPLGLQRLQEWLREAIVQLPRPEYVSEEIMVSACVLALLCLASFVGGAFVSGITLNTGDFRRLIWVLSPLGPYLTIAAVVSVVLGWSGNDPRSNSVVAQEVKKTTRVIGGVIGAEVMTYYSATAMRGFFSAVSGGLFGCVLICIFTLISDNNTRLTSRAFIEGLGVKTLPCIVFGAICGTNIRDAICFILNASLGLCVGMLLTPRIHEFLLRRGTSRVNLSSYHMYLTTKGAVLGNIVSAVLLQLLHPVYSVAGCLLVGGLVGTGVGLICGDIYLPWLKKLISVPDLPSNVNPSRNYITLSTDGLQRGSILAMGTFLGGLVGLAASAQILGVFVFAMLGLYFFERSMSSVRFITRDVMQHYLHCVLGALVGSFIGVFIALGITWPLLGPLAGICIETCLFRIHRSDMNEL